MLESINVKNKIKLLLLSLLWIYPSLMWGAEPGAPSAPVEAPKKRISIKFENELVQGNIENPTMDYLFVRKEANYKKMMRLRDNFLPEVKKGKRDFSGSH